jgi:hypothetical protein
MAVQALPDEHDTPTSWDPVFGPLGAGVGWTVQLVPSQCSTRGASKFPATWLQPTATQSVGEVQDTPFRAPATNVVGKFVLAIVQLVPSHFSMSACWVSEVS